VKKLSRNSKTSRLTESAFVAGILIIFALIGTLIFPFIDFIYALPAILLAKRQDYKASIMALTAAGIIATILLGVQSGMYYLILYTPMAAVMSYFIYKDKKPSLTIFSGGLAFLASFIVLLFIMQLFLEVSLVDYITNMFRESMQLQENFFSNFEGMQEQLQSSEDFYENLITTAVRIIPSIVILMAAGMVTINYYVAQKIAKRLKINIRRLGSFQNFRLPNNIVLGMIVIAVLTFLVGRLNIVNSEALTDNFIILFQLVFLIQGLALVRFMISKYNVTRIVWAGVLLGVILVPIFTIMLLLAGIADSIFDFRELKESNR
jgi:uncharacterized protein YybS (DUF2232 family)